ncbi:unnamed protein product, partial [Ixodes pacificus]
MVHSRDFGDTRGGDGITTQARVSKAETMTVAETTTVTKAVAVAKTVAGTKAVAETKAGVAEAAIAK